VFFETKVWPKSDKAGLNHHKLILTMSLTHVSLPTGQNHFKEMRDFYLAALAPLGYGVFMEAEKKFIGMGKKHASPDFWLHCGGIEFEKFDGNVEKMRGKTHVAFMVNSKADVHRWYNAAM
jgi:hypothetical protein